MLKLFSITVVNRGITMMYFGCSSSTSLRCVAEKNFEQTTSSCLRSTTGSSLDLKSRVDGAYLKIYKQPTASLADLQVINEAYRARVYPLGELPFPQVILDAIHDYIHARWSRSMYEFAPEIINPRLTLQHSLDLDDQMEEPNTFCLSPSKSNPEPSGYGKVSFVRFMRNVQSARWFVVKEPILAKSGFIEEEAKGTLVRCENNLEISLKTADSPHFMKVAGVVVKGKPDDFTPYLILEYIEGKELQILLSNRALSPEDQRVIFVQFMKAILFLFEKGICPKDISSRNLLFTDDKQLKFIDFDFWFVTNDLSMLARELCARAKWMTVLLMNYRDRGAQELGINEVFVPFDCEMIPTYYLDYKDIKGSFNAYFDELSKWFNTALIETVAESEAI